MPTPQTLVIIDPATRTAEVECYEEIAHRAAPLSSSYHLPALEGMSSLQGLERTDAIIILGSGASVYDDLPWQRPLNEWVYERMEAGVPTLGICYGHQMLAHIYGAPVDLLWDGHKEKGVRQVKLHSERLGLRDQEGPLTVSHREGVTQCPSKFRVFATSPACSIDGIEHRILPIWGVQPHVEAVDGFVRNNEIRVTDPEATFAYGYRFIDAFLNFVLSNG